ncbi:MAG: hypothetical protein ABI054_11385 [Planctomycetota bacterium]
MDDDVGEGFDWAGVDHDAQDACSGAQLAKLKQREPRFRCLRRVVASPARSVGYACPLDEDVCGDASFRQEDRTFEAAAGSDRQDHVARPGWYEYRRALTRATGIGDHSDRVTGKESAGLEVSLRIADNPVHLAIHRICPLGCQSFIICVVHANLSFGYRSAELVEHATCDDSLRWSEDSVPAMVARQKVQGIDLRLEDQFTRTARQRKGHLDHSPCVRATVLAARSNRQSKGSRIVGRRGEWIPRVRVAIVIDVANDELQRLIREHGAPLVNGAIDRAMPEGSLLRLQAKANDFIGLRRTLRQDLRAVLPIDTRRSRFERDADFNPLHSRASIRTPALHASEYPVDAVRVLHQELERRLCLDRHAMAVDELDLERATGRKRELDSGGKFSLPREGGMRSLVREKTTDRDLASFWNIAAHERLQMAEARDAMLIGLGMELDSEVIERAKNYVDGLRVRAFLRSDMDLE